MPLILIVLIVLLILGALGVMDRAFSSVNQQGGARKKDVWNNEFTTYTFRNYSIK